MGIIDIAFEQLFLYSKKMKKNRARPIAIILTLFSFGSINEAYRILTSNDADIADNRTSLIPMAVGLTAVAIFFTIRFWNKAAKEKTM